MVVGHVRRENHFIAFRSKVESCARDHPAPRTETVDASHRKLDGSQGQCQVFGGGILLQPFTKLNSHAHHDPTHPEFVATLSGMPFQKEHELFP